MKNERKEKKQKKQKLLIEVGLITFIIFIATLSFTLFSDYVLTRETYLNSKNEMIERDLTTLRSRVEGVKNIGWVFDYVNNNPDDILRPMTEEEQEESMSDEVLSKVDALIDGDVDPDEADAKTQLYYARQIYDNMALNLNRNDFDYAKIWQIEILNEHEAVVYLDESTYDNFDYTAQVIQFEESEHSAVKELLSSDGKEKKKYIYELYRDPSDGKSYYIGYTPLENVNGRHFYLCVQDDWSEFHDNLMAHIKKSMIVGVLVLFVLNSLLMIFVYRRVISPVMKVKSGVQDYMDDKNSEAVIEKMENIKVRNEIGVLADSFSDLASEIDRYTNEILTLQDEKTRASTELALARNIQNSMLPSTFPAFPERREFDIYASMDPAKAVGGDFYDFFLIDDDHLCMIIADVSGKGVPAALFMMASNIILKNQSMPGKTPAQILMDANKVICANNKEKMFVTVWLGILELSTGKLCAANGGHEYPAIMDETGKFSLYKDKHGLVVGAMEIMVYMDYELTLKPGDKIFVYTDGVPEATNSENELFGTDRMVEALNIKPEAAPQDILATVRETVDGFVKDAEQFDDLTMLCLEYHG